MIEYNKIETLWQRDMEGTKKLMEGVFRNPTVEFLKDNAWQFSEKVDGCLVSKTKIIMADGTTKCIRDVKEGDLVIGYDTDSLEYKIVPVIATQCKSRAGEWVKIKTTRTGLNKGNSYGLINCTHDHKVWTKNRGYVEAYKLTTDDIILNIRTDLTELTPLQEQVLVGKMLGDGTLTVKQNNGMNTANVAWGQKEEDYTDWCVNILHDLGTKGGCVTSGYGTTMYRGRTKNTVAIYNLFSSWAISGTKEVPKNIKLTPISMAFWYMDDGTLCHAEDQEDRVRFATNGFSLESCEHLVRELKRYDIEAAIKDYKGNTIGLTADNAEKLFLLIAPYICESKKYKLPERYRSYPCYLPEDKAAQYKKVVVEQKVISIEKDTKPHCRWDIQTETHNFFTVGGLVHNTNIRIHWDGHKVNYGGRTEAAQIPAHLMNKLIEMFGTEEAEQIFEQKFGGTEVILFGEGYGPKIQKGGGNYHSEVSFILFDVYIAGNYQPRSSVEDVAKAFGIDVVPIVLEGTIQDGVDYVKANPKSTMGTAMMEGVVGRPKIEMRDRCGNRVIVKIKVNDFK